MRHPPSHPSAKLTTMALATLYDTLPAGPPVLGTDHRTPVPQPGLAARMASLHAGLCSLLADLEPGLLLGGEAAALYADFCSLDRLVTGGRTLLAPRIAESGVWQEEGHRSPAGLLATLEGGSAGRAKRTLEAGRRLADLPGTEVALRKGSLSGPKLDEITHAASLDPRSEELLLAGSESEPFHVVRERCQRVRTTAAGQDPRATLNRIHRERSFSTWTDAEGAFCYQGRDTAERGARLLARLVPVANRLRHDRRSAAAAEAKDRPKGTAQAPPEPEAALRADALFLLMTGTGPMPASSAAGGRQPGPRRSPCGPETFDGTDAPPSGPASPTVTGPSGTNASGAVGRTTTDAVDACGDASGMADPSELGSATDRILAAPPTTVIVRVDLAALRRGRVLPGELSEIEGHGPVPVPVVQGLADDAFLACVFTEAGDIRAVAHLGRTINQHLRTALALRDKRCVVPGCGVGYALEIDHVIPLESGGDTRIDNLALLCSHHHRKKTYEGWTLRRTGPTDDDPGWTFTPLPPFGQEPDLGLDRADRRPPGD